MQSIKSILVLCLLLIGLAAKSQFELLNKFGESTDTSLVIDIDCTQGYCLLVGPNEIATTSDAGTSYEYKNSPNTLLNETNRHGQIIDSSTYFISTLDYYLDFRLSVSFDNGVIWDYVLDLSSEIPQCFNYEMYSSKSGMVGCTNGQIIRTSTQFVFSDTLNLSDGNNLVKDILFANDSSAIAIEGQNAWWTQSFGDSWDTLKSFENGGIESISSPSPEVFVAALPQYNPSAIKVAKTNNDGEDWTEFDVAGNFHELSSKIYFANDTIGLAIGAYRSSNPMLYFTLSSGLNWDTLEIPYLSQVTDIELVNDSIALISGTEGVLIRLHLNQLSIPPPPDTTDTTSSIIEFQESTQFQLYPNPANDKITIQTNGSFSGNLGINLYDQVGRSLGMVFNGKSDSGKIEIDIQWLASGMYFLNISFRDRIEQLSFVKQ